MRHPLNPEAGAVQVPADPRLVEAAVAAGPVTYRVYPYYDWRWGDRGRAFTRSDSAWLAWLAGQESATIDSQLQWLWRLLSRRGMPGAMLELHLQVLARHLTRAVPERAGAHARLAAAGRRLGERRAAVLHPDAAEELASAFHRAVLEGSGVGTSRLVHGTGLLIASAVADEGNGATGAIEALAGWLRDVEGLRGNAALQAVLDDGHRRALADEAFPDRWRDAVDRVVAMGVRALEATAAAAG